MIFCKEISHCATRLAAYGIISVSRANATFFCNPSLVFLNIYWSELSWWLGTQTAVRRAKTGHKESRLFVHISAHLSYGEPVQPRDRPIFFDQVRHQTKYGYIGNKYFFTKSSHHQTYQKYEQPPQILQFSYFQSHFSASKFNGIFLIFFSVMNIRLGDQLLEMIFLKTLIL